MNGKISFLVHEFVFMSHLGKGELNCKTHGLTLSIGTFETLVWCGDQNLQTKLKVNSNERKVERGNRREKKKTYKKTHKVKTKRHNTNGLP
jgi:hypothetical protein